MYNYFLFLIESAPDLPTAGIGAIDDNLEDEVEDNQYMNSRSPAARHFIEDVRYLRDRGLECMDELVGLCLLDSKSS